ncbi:hypothetical protein RI054_30g121630 [Pseudoscourfieldia marina]
MVKLARPDDYFDLFDDEFQDFCQTNKAVSPGILRSQVRKFLEATGATATSFQEVIGVNSNSYGKFMRNEYKDNWNAVMNGTYDKARYFFFREKKLGKKSMANMYKNGGGAAAPAPAPAAPPPPPTGAMGAPPPPPPSGSAAPPAPPAPAAGAGAGARPPLPDVSAVELDDENVYLTPKEVRAAITALGKKYKFTHQQLVDAFGCTCAGNAVGRFMSKSGDFGGGEMDMYRPAALFFEKLRVHEGKPKSKKRKALEEEAQGRKDKKPFLGLDPNKKYWVMPDTVAMKDSLGRFRLW